MYHASVSGVKESRSKSLMDGKGKKKKALERKSRERERMDCMDSSHDPSHTEAGLLVMKGRTERSKYEERNETLKGESKVKRWQLENEGQGDEPLLE